MFGGHERTQALGPFDERDTLGKGIFDPEFIGILGPFQPVQIEMP